MQSPDPGNDDGSGVSGIYPQNTPQLFDTAVELSSWFRSLRQPETNDGPRRWRSSYNDAEWSSRGPEGPGGENPDDMELLSVLLDYPVAGIFEAARIISPVTSSSMEGVYDKITQGCLTRPEEGGFGGDEPKGPNDEKPAALEYDELDRARHGAANIYKSWQGQESIWAHEFQWDLFNFQVHTENISFCIAEHLVKYRAMFHKAGEDTLQILQRLLELCPRPNNWPNETGTATFNLKSFLVSSLVSAASTVVTVASGGTAVPALTTLAISMVGTTVNAMDKKPADDKRVSPPADLRSKNFEIDDTHFLHDVLKKCRERLDEIIEDLADAIGSLTRSLRDEMTGRRESRRYELLGKLPHDDMSDKVPWLLDYWPEGHSSMGLNVDPEGMKEAIANYLSPTIVRLGKLAGTYAEGHSFASGASGDEGWIGGDGGGGLVRTAASSFLEEVAAQIKVLSTEQGELRDSFTDYQTRLLNFSSAIRNAENENAKVFDSIAAKLSSM